MTRCNLAECLTQQLRVQHWATVSHPFIKGKWLCDWNSNRKSNSVSSVWLHLETKAIGDIKIQNISLFWWFGVPAADRGCCSSYSLDRLCNACHFKSYSTVCEQSGWFQQCLVRKSFQILNTTFSWHDTMSPNFWIWTRNPVITTNYHALSLVSGRNACGKPQSMVIYQTEWNSGRWQSEQATANMSCSKTFFFSNSVYTNNVLNAGVHV